MNLPVFQADARSILSPTGGFIAEAGFTHSLTPARNCTYGCTYCYVPTMHVFGGLKREDWEHWGKRTTFKSNAASLLRRELRADQIIYCSPLVDPYQPAETVTEAMPALLDEVLQRPPKVFVLQTRGPRILRDIAKLRSLASVTQLRVSFSVSTDCDEVRRRYEPHCEPISERLAVIRELRRQGIEVYATLAPLLPCNPEALATIALEASGLDLIGDPFHVRTVKRSGATTRDAARRISRVHREDKWFDPAYQQEVILRIAGVAKAHGRRFGTGPEGFSWLARDTSKSASL